MVAPRSSAFWIGSAGGGDGQALIGMVLVGGFVCLSGLALMAISSVLALLVERRAKQRLAAQG